MEWIRRQCVRWGLAPKHAHHTLFQHVLHHLPGMAIFFLIGLTLEQLGWLRGLESHTLDGMLGLFDRPMEEVPPIWVVAINDEDYDTEFHSTSPLDPDRLHEILTWVAAARPAVIGVDIDTNSPRFSGRTWPRAVWVRNARPVLPPGADPLEIAYTPEALEQVVRDPVLGGDAVERLGDAHTIVTDPPSGPPLLQQDFDGVVRHYHRVLPHSITRDESGVTGRLPSFFSAVVQEYVHAMKDQGRGNEAAVVHAERCLSHADRHGFVEVGLRFGGPNTRFSRMSISALRTAAQQDYWSDKSPLRDAIVLIGGTYLLGRDYYYTPMGPRWGVDIAAHAIATEFSGRGIHETNHRLALAMELAVGLTFLYLSWRFPGNSAFQVGLVAVVVLSLLGSLVAFQALAYWFNFVPLLFGQWLELQWSHFRERRDLLRRVQALSHPSPGSGSEHDTGSEHDAIH